MSAKPDQTAIAAAIDSLLAQKPEERAYDDILAWTDAGVFDAWQDDSGRTLLHFAAALGNETLVDKIHARGIGTGAVDNNNLSPADIARAYGHDLLAEKLADRSLQASKTKKSAAPSYHSLQEIREASRKSGQNIFYVMARRGEFKEVTDLAAKDPLGLTAEDLLSQNKYGDTVLLALCRQGSLGLLLEKSLWDGRSAIFDKIWENVPKAYKKGLNGDSLLSRIKQGKFIARRPLPIQRLKK